MQQLQSDLAGRTVEASAGAGLVRVTVDGRGLVRSLDIDSAAFDGRDPELLADLILSAVAEAQRRSADLVQAEVRRAQGLGPGPTAP